MPNTGSGGVRIVAMGKGRTIATATYMQDVASKASGGCPNDLVAGQQYSLTDSRDGQIYTVTRLGDGNCWMTRDIAIGCDGIGETYGNAIVSRTLTPDDSNVASEWNTPILSADKTKNTTGCTTSNTSDCNSFVTPRITCDSTYGAMYNMVAVTAGAVTGSGNWSGASQDVCPSGWKLASMSDFIGITSYGSAFSPQGVGYFHNGSITAVGRVWYASSTPNGAHNQGLYWSGSALSTFTTGDRSDTGPNRCILK